MRFICAVLVGLIALPSIAAAQSLPGGPSRLPQKGLTRPDIPKTVPRVPNRGGLRTPDIPKVVPRNPVIVPVPRVCPKGTTGKWPKCTKVAKPDGKACPEGQVRKRRRCVTVTKDEPVVPKIVTPGAKPCPEGYERKRRRCVKSIPPRSVEPDAPVTPELATPKREPVEPKPPAPKREKADPKPPAPKIERAEPVPPPAPKVKSAEPVPPPPTRKQTQAGSVPPAVAALTAGRPHRPAEILALVEESRADAIAARLESQYDLDADPPEPLALLDRALLRLRLDPGQALEPVLVDLSADPDFDLVQPNYDYRASEKQTLPQTGPQYAKQAMRLEQAHRVSRGRDVKIAVIDTAIEADHPELVDVIADVFDAVGEGPSRPEQHGTEIAGILGARAKLKGVAPDAKILSVRAFRGDETGPAQSTSLQLARGIDWAFDAGAKIMNMSFAGPLDPLFERIVTAAADKGVIFVAAAGNDGPKAPPVYPAAYPQVIAVTATDEKDRVYDKANRGDYIAIAAPGVDIIAPTLKDGYGLSSGTSMAAAHVSGVVALLLERDADLSAADIRTILSSSARKPAEPLAKDVVGAGIVDAAKAVDSGKDEAPASAKP